MSEKYQIHIEEKQGHQEEKKIEIDDQFQMNINKPGRSYTETELNRIDGLGRNIFNEITDFLPFRDLQVIQVTNKKMQEKVEQYCQSRIRSEYISSTFGLHIEQTTDIINRAYKDMSKEKAIKKLMDLGSEYKNIEIEMKKRQTNLITKHGNMVGAQDSYHEVLPFHGFETNGWGDNLGRDGINWVDKIFIEDSKEIKLSLSHGNFPTIKGILCNSEDNKMHRVVYKVGNELQPIIKKNTHAENISKALEIMNIQGSRKLMSIALRKDFRRIFDRVGAQENIAKTDFKNYLKQCVQKNSGSQRRNFNQSREMQGGGGGNNQRKQQPGLLPDHKFAVIKEVQFKPSSQFKILTIFGSFDDQRLESSENQDQTALEYFKMETQADGLDGLCGLVLQKIVEIQKTNIPQLEEFADVYEGPNSVPIHPPYATFKRSNLSDKFKDMWPIIWVSMQQENYHIQNQCSIPIQAAAARYVYYSINQEGGHGKFPVLNLKGYIVDLTDQRAVEEYQHMLTTSRNRLTGSKCVLI